MQQNIKLTDIVLFYGFTDTEISRLLELLGAVTTKYSEQRTIVREGESNPYIFLLLSGEAFAVRYSIDGKEEVFTQMTDGSVIGDVLAVSSGSLSPVTVKVLPGAVILHFSFDRLVNAEGKSSELRTRLLKNLTAELADKFFEQQERINCLIRPSLREKITMFLKNESKRKKSTVFNIPMNRERLAIYLNTNRSALSRELSRMKRAGVIDYYKNSFNLKKDVEYYDNQTHEKEREA